MSEPALKIETLASQQRLDLLERLWDSLSPSDVGVTDEQRAELDRRLDALERDAQNGRALGVPWDEVLRQIQAHR